MAISSGTYLATIVDVLWPLAFKQSPEVSCIISGIDPKCQTTPKHWEVFHEMFLLMKYNSKETWALSEKSMHISEKDYRVMAQWLWEINKQLASLYGAMKTGIQEIINI